MSLMKEVAGIISFCMKVRCILYVPASEAGQNEYTVSHAGRALCDVIL
jgi:hypothetical protein